MLKNTSFARIVFFSTLLGVASYAGSLAVFLLNSIGLDTTVREALFIAGARPGLFGIAYLLQGMAFLLWALVPISVGQRYREHAPGFSQLAAIAGSFGFIWRAVAEFAKAGSMEFLGQVYRTGDPTLQLFAEQLATWTQLWTFGAIWELVGNGFALGVFTAIAGLLFVAAGRSSLGGITTFVGSVIAISWIGTAVYYLLGLRAGLQWIGAPGYATLVIAPVWLAWIAWYVQRAPQDRVVPAAKSGEAVPEPAG